MSFSLTILGSNSALPTSNRFPTAQLLTVNEQYLLIDCGEGTQMQLRKYKAKIQRIHHIFISHLHGDHYFGVPGLLFSMNLLGRTTPLHLYAPAQLLNILQAILDASNAKLKYELVFHPLSEGKHETLLNDKHLSVEAFPLAHKIPCWGFLFKEKPKPLNLIKEKITQYKIPLEALPAIKNGDDYKFIDGRIITNQELTHPPKPPATYAFCTDTRYHEEILPIIHEAHTLYHEATYLKESTEKAKENFHSTAEQAATMAKKAKVKQLIIGHYSARYKDLQPFLEEAQEVFENSLLAVEGKQYTI